MLNRHPKLRVYLMHAGHPFLAETIGILHIYPQVYLDIAVMNWIQPREEFYAYLKALIQAGLADRIMFGSDQMVWPDAIGLAVNAIESADFLTLPLWGPARERSETIGSMSVLFSFNGSRYTLYSCILGHTAEHAAAKRRLDD